MRCFRIEMITYGGCAGDGDRTISGDLMAEDAYEARRVAIEQVRRCGMYVRRFININVVAKGESR